MDHILKNCYLGFCRYFHYWEATRLCLDPTKYCSVHFLLRNLLPSSNTWSDCQVRYSKRKALKCPGSRTLGLLREVFELQRFTTTLSPQRYLFPMRHWILEQDGGGINWVCKAFCIYFWKKNRSWMKRIFVKSYIHCYLKLMGGDSTFFSDENSGGKKAIIISSWRKKGYLSPL